jgi:hypothetical protein
MATEKDLKYLHQKFIFSGKILITSIAVKGSLFMQHELMPIQDGWKGSLKFATSHSAFELPGEVNASMGFEMRPVKIKQISSKKAKNWTLRNTFQRRIYHKFHTDSLSCDLG